MKDKADEGVGEGVGEGGEEAARRDTGSGDERLMRRNKPHDELVKEKN